MWNIARRRDFENRDSRGFSLVEILIALAIAAIIMTGVASLIFTSLRLYGSGNANAEIQNESQRVLNLTIDNIMEAGGICMRLPAAGDNSICVLTEELTILERSGGFWVLYRGPALAYREDAEELLLIDLQDAFPDANTEDDADGNRFCVLAANQPVANGRMAAAGAALTAAEAFITGTEMDDAAERLPWTMGQGVTGFVVIPVSGGADPPFRHESTTLAATTYDTAGAVEHRYFYTEPLTLRIGLSFTNSTYDADRPISREISDDVAVRSRLPVIYIDDRILGMQEYKRD